MQVHVISSTLPHEVEGRIVLSFYRATYRPGELEGRPVNSEMTLLVNVSPATDGE